MGLMLPAASTRAVRIDGGALDLLMPMHVCLAPSGRIAGCGPTLRKLCPSEPVGQGFFELFDVRRPDGIATIADLSARAGERLSLGLRPGPPSTLRGVAALLADGLGLLVNLSFGISVPEAVRAHALTDADFAATDLAVELLYLVEVKAAVMGELRDLNARLQDARRAAEEQARTDMLTGLRNRRAMDQAVDEAIRSGQPFGLMHIDLDFFKAVNDSLGHAAGDHVLREVARILSDETRAGDTVARVGGDEFVVILPGLDGGDVLSGVARRMIRRLQRPMVFGGEVCCISASIGLTLSRQHAAPTAERLLAEADRALYAAKRAGRGRAVLALTGETMS